MYVYIYIYIYIYTYINMYLYTAKTCSARLSVQIVEFDVNMGTESCHRRRLLLVSLPLYVYI